MIFVSSKEWETLPCKRHKTSGWSKSSQTEDIKVSKSKSSEKKKHKQSSLDLYKYKHQAYEERREHFREVYGDIEYNDDDVDDDNFM